ncbi:MAG: 16S rRNA (uracil(1498)-N(3))-methyltransferase [Litorivicinaceae bacterium]|nr:16S rRNA (uracil(1498)-N(3))-methyltransferase [Litorivicinaceae bacterium]
MRTTRLWVSDLSASAGAIVLNERNHHYLTRVLRAKQGAPLILFDGQGRVAEAEIQAITKQTTTVTVTTPHQSPDTRVPIVLCLSIIKPDRFDWALQKATELGASGIQPLTTCYTEGMPKGERLQKKFAHWHEILVNACEQSEHYWLPTLHPIKEFSTWLTAPRDRIVIAHPDCTISSIPATSGLTHLLIGPEGGFTDLEVQQAIQAGATGLSLGPRILRAETAAVVGMTLLARDLGFL